LIKPGLKLAIKNGHYKFVISDAPPDKFDLLHNKISFIIDYYWLHDLML